MDTKQSSEKRFALLIDADNVSAKYIKPITDELSKYGTVTYKRIYGDWTLTLHAKWKDALLENSITPIQQFGYTQGKNATDSAMIIDAMDILYTRSVEGFCIVSSDSDFTRLASRIRESGLTVIGMGEKKTPVPFRKACDIFTTLELLLPNAGANAKSNGRAKGARPEQAVSTGAQNAGPSIEEIEQAVVNIITDNLNNGKSTGLGEVGSRLLKRYPDFDVRSYGTNQLKKLLDEFGGVVVTKDGSSVTVELAEDKEGAKEPVRKPAKEAPAKEPEPEEPAEKPEAAAEEEPSAKPAARRSPRRRREHAAAPVEAAERPAQEASPVESPVEPEAAAEPVAEQDASEAPARKPARRGKRGGAKRSRAQTSQPEQEAPAEAAQEPAPASEPEPAASAEAPAKRRAPRAKKPAAAPAPEQPAGQASPDRFIRQLVRESGAEGIAISELAKRVRATYRDFKVRDLGYPQFRAYVADLDDVDIEKVGKDFIARLAE
ncbi:NYN domain-containing protein [Arabiibacter massiliensis]|uniref:NYN domain-containing protein n=1 Tax=Arabiibacter massiliensis TaxID=1870985 RepID=UPI0009BA7761|nr:NYN domain-containing protein [Arabiibacter massiliensis]